MLSLMMRDISCNQMKQITLILLLKLDANHRAFTSQYSTTWWPDCRLVRTEVGLRAPCRTLFSSAQNPLSLSTEHSFTQHRTHFSSAKNHLSLSTEPLLLSTEPSFAQRRTLLAQHRPLFSIPLFRSAQNPLSAEPSLAQHRTLSVQNPL